MLRRSIRCAQLLGLTAALFLSFAVVRADAVGVDRPVVAVVGDSYTAAWGAIYDWMPPTTKGAWWEYTARDLGWTPGTIVATTGAGFVKRGGQGRNFLEALQRTPIAPDTDFVLLQGGLNDQSQSPSAVAAGERAVLALIRQQAPQATVIVIGGFLPSPTKVTPNYVWVARAIGKPDALGGALYVSPFMLSFPVAKDGVHPTGDGHRSIGRWIAWRIAHGMDNAPGFHKDSTGTFYTN